MSIVIENLSRLAAHCELQAARLSPFRAERIFLEDLAERYRGVLLEELSRTTDVMSRIASPRVTISVVYLSTR